jgi:hypothetical protein
MIRDPTHPLFGRTFHVIRPVQRGGNFPISYEVQYRDGISLLVPVAATEPQDGIENRTKLSVEALHDLTSLVEQLELDADRSEGPLGHAASSTAVMHRVVEDLSMLEGNRGAVASTAVAVALFSAYGIPIGW